MKDLIEALNIFLKYSNAKYPTNCINNELYVDVDPKIVSKDDILRLVELGFIARLETNGFVSFRFGEMI